MLGSTLSMAELIVGASAEGLVTESSSSPPPEFTLASINPVAPMTPIAAKVVPDAPIGAHRAEDSIVFSTGTAS